MSEKKPLVKRRTSANALAGTLCFDGSVVLRQKQARRPPAWPRLDRRCPVVLLAENRESARVVLKNVLESAGSEVIVIEHAAEALSIAVAYSGRIDFLIIEVGFPGINGGLLAHLLQCVHPETRALFLSGSVEEVLICSSELDQRIAVLKQPVRLDVFASKVSEMIATPQGAQK
jgi:CheY-like chemotaxis protein